ncbi:hypothetical protein Leryth_012103 [Lithospermum erythrorhizon]|nr:hypothetical protein Leryth_012103 [Lithospermum erythrorhizon]
MTGVIDGQSLTGQNMTGVIDCQSLTPQGLGGENLRGVIDGQSLTPRGPDGKNSRGVIDGQSVTEGIDGHNLKDVNLTELIDGESLSLSETKKNSKKRLPVELAGRPDWLPDDWRYEIRMRVSGATAGSYDRYYFSPTGKNFRSRAEVLRFLETGSRKKKRGSEDETPPASSEKPKAKRPKRKKGDFSNVDFDYKNPPKNVSWMLTNASHDIWMPIADEVLAPESVQRTWEDAFSCITELESKK